MLHARIFSFDLTVRGAYAVVHAEGELDIAAVDELRGCVQRAARRAPDVVVDLRPVTFMDTYALRALMRLQRDAFVTPEWSLHIVPGCDVQRVLDLADARRELRWISAEQLPG